MIAIKIKDIKTFMHKLLNSALFDSFLLEKAHIRTYNSFIIDGRMNLDFFSKEELKDLELVSFDYSMWKNVKPLIFQIIKGKKVPSFFKITLLLSPQKALELLEHTHNQHLSQVLKFFVITVKFDSHGLLVTCGTSYTTFVIEKDVDLVWDQYFCNFLSENSIDYDL